MLKTKLQFPNILTLDKIWLVVNYNNRKNIVIAIDLVKKKL